MFWVVPRHLAGDDGILAEQVGATLTGLGWRMWPTSRSTLLYTSPDGLCGAEWVRACYPIELGGLPVAWQITARAHPDSVLREWNVYITEGVPHEAVADFLLALNARTEPTAGFTGPHTVLDALVAQGWLLDIDHPATTATAPDLAATVSLEAIPEHVFDADPRPGLAGWQAWADPCTGTGLLWCATFSASVPHDLVAAFASSLASPAPVPRRTLPDGARDRLTVIPPG
ncbi:DUF317 domain-containing protein [Streptomyces sp. SID5473]|uniref:DUF317 domain-containing protein n=1 Tax=Streptomyces tsukubensis (strain DSM 42081 / NBRC 108919 / NRRL 18488 / 9993) TaxID=1114943 RepID=A0A7G3UN42_STRT9|nr:MULTISPECIES: DUF317 domain-containing protein [Streptomyces]AZK98671.1 SPDY domain containing protein [Streptomyces tsukubensis]MYS66474.1 DUF317 domain-containing protein [Streptomyces sp. SID5473]QKM71428.1 DUF317 domain-containing protein [Streptomyces tsukubensis NRRL18488]TAI41612.1 DUF317 domain-containing protein [Streptomyces tsukubensis]